MLQDNGFGPMMHIQRNEKIIPVFQNQTCVALAFLAFRRIWVSPSAALVVSPNCANRFLWLPFCCRVCVCARVSWICFLLPLVSSGLVLLNNMLLLFSLLSNRCAAHRDKL